MNLTKRSCLLRSATTTTTVRSAFAQVSYLETVKKETQPASIC